MAAITSITENWSGHSFKEVETHIKGSYLPLTSVSVDSISSNVANILTLNSSNAVKKTSLDDLALLLGVGGTDTRYDPYNFDSDDSKGIYHIQCDSIPSNAPFNSSSPYRGYLIVYGNYNYSEGKYYCVQIYYECYSPTYRGKVFVRASCVMGWTDWREL